MRNIISFKNPCAFQGSKYLEGNKNYFEGWYFKNTNDMEGISFIPGISINKNERKAFIQVITNDSSYNIDYDIEEFEYSNDPFKIKIGNSYFAFDSIHIDIYDKNLNLSIYEDLEYSNSSNITINWLSPNIMGIFSYVPYMECNHAIISMKNRINGNLSINGECINFNNSVSVLLRKDGYLLEFNATYDNDFRLNAPVKGTMSKDIVESIDSNININLKKGDNVIFSGKSKAGGLEIVIR